MNPKSSRLEPFIAEKRIERIDSVLEARTQSVTVVLDSIQNPHNVSAVLRSADAFGLSDIHFVGGRLQYSKGISIGAERWLNLQYHDSAEDAVEALTDAGFELVTLQPREKNPKSVPVFDLDFTKRLALVFGNERDGVSDAFVARAHHAAHIPMHGFVESFNISVAAAICLFCTSVSNVSGERLVAPLGEEEREKMRLRWLTNDVRGGDLILKAVEGADD